MIETDKTQEFGKPAPEDTRDRILGAAREVMARKGKKGATTREIAEVAGVNEATLFRHFGTKEALIIACARRFCPDVQLRDFIAGLEGPVEEDLFKIGQGLTQQLESVLDMIRWSLVEIEYENSVFAQEAWKPQTAVRSVIVDYMTSRVASGELVGNPEDLASIFTGILFARVIAREKYADNRLFTDTEYALRTIIDVFLNGVRSK